MNHYINLHNYINENYCNLNYDIDYFIEKGSLKLLPKLDPMDLVIDISYPIKLLIQTIVNINFLITSIDPKKRRNILEKYKNLKEQIHFDRNLLDLGDRIYKFAKKKAEENKYKNIPDIKEKLLPKFKINSEKDFIALTKDAIVFNDLISTLKKNENNDIRKFLQELHLTNLTIKEGVKVFEYLDACFYHIYFEILVNYDYFDEDEPKRKRND